MLISLTKKSIHLAKYSQLHRLPIPSHEMIAVICLTFTTKKAQVRVILGVAEWKIIVGQLLFCGEGIIQRLFHLLYYVGKTRNSSPMLKLPQARRNMRSDSGIRSSPDFA